MSKGPRVKVQQGELQGGTHNTPAGKEYYSYLGIPYAKPPVGSLRFKDPQPPDSWIGVLDATKPGHKCAQIDPMRPRKFEGSEDCLYLNVYSPILPANNINPLPVMFYVHGGRYLAGYGDYYRPDYFIDHDVIVVTINYRLSILGFMCLDTPDVPGNAGLKDAAIALKWVRNNVTHFGGDPNNITVFGESAGGGTVSSFLVSPMTEGLFHKAIIESGCCVTDVFTAKEDEIGKAKQIVTLLGKETTNTELPKDLLLTLQNVPVEDLLDAVCVVERMKRNLKSTFSAVTEKTYKDVVPFFAESPAVSLSQGRYYKVPILTGYNSYEGAFFITRDAQANLVYDSDSKSYVPKFLEINDSDKAQHFGDEVKQFYFGNRPIGDNVKTDYVNLLSDHHFIRDTYRFVDYIAKHQSDIWFYRFSFMGSMSSMYVKSLGLKGASHSEILPYQFFRPNKANNLKDSDIKLIKFFSEAWTSFAKFGKPTWKAQEFSWLPAGEQRYCLSIDSELKLLAYPEKRRIEFWKSLVKKYSHSHSKI